MLKPQLSIPMPSPQCEAQVEQIFNADIREEREDLKEAAEKTLNVILDLSLDGIVRWVSPSWTDVIGTSLDAVRGKPIKELLVGENKDIFAEVTEKMKFDETRSQFIRFTTQLGPASKLANSYFRDHLINYTLEGSTKNESPTIELEGQGILVTARPADRECQLGDSVAETHTMWMIRPWIAPCEIQIDLPDVIVEFLGSGAEVLASYLTTLAEAGVEDPASISPPPPVLCRICECQIPPWWFEKHTELCLQEHRAEMEIQLSQDNLLEHRHAIVKVLDSLEAERISIMNLESPNHVTHQAEYKNVPIGSSSLASSSSSSGTVSHGVQNVRSRELSTGGNNHSRRKSFAIRRPVARIVELLLDLCDTAIEISTPEFKESASNKFGEFRVQSPQSEGRIFQVIQWQSPSTNTLDQEQGLAKLCADTERVAKAKVEAVIRYRRIIEYTERIRIEFSVMVQDCIDEAIRKAARITAGYLTDSDEEGTETYEIGSSTGYPISGQSNLRVARELTSDGQKFLSPTANSSTRSSSPKEFLTSRTQPGNQNCVPLNQDFHRHSLLFESDTGGDSDGSVRSLSVMTRVARNESPVSEIGDLRRAASSRQHHRRSIILPGSSSPRRQESPVRHPQPSSPLRINKPRSLASTYEGFASPVVSPMHIGSEFSSPALLPHHHRRQSSAAGSDPSRPPPSPRLSTVGVPQARIVPPSIKDFEIIKPISKGAFGSVYLAKKKSTGDYYAIKVLKKADMVAKNQVTNVKAERAIMMWQGESEFVAKLYWTFSSKDYLYLVMEYLNGGDCASLIKALGGLPEDWARKYLGEVILGVKHLHSRGIVHRDLKPDNLLIDQKGHLKLTDFGLSRMGLIGRQKRVLDSSMNDTTPDLLRQGPFSRTMSISSSRSTSLDVQGNNSPSSSSLTLSEHSLTTPSYFNLNRDGISKKISRRASGRSESGETLLQIFNSFSLNDSDSQKLNKQQSLSTDEQYIENEGGSNDYVSSNQVDTTHGYEHKNSSAASMMPPPMALFDPDDSNRRFVGTPDYLAPETVKGIGQDETSDWWSVGCILFEFLHGYPPFHAATPDEVFENILARRISWPEEGNSEVSNEARNLVDKLLCIDPKQRLGANINDEFECGGDEIQAHPWFEGVVWDKLLEDEAQFVPAPQNPEDTEYFDSRGAILQSFSEELEDQTSPQASTMISKYHERPHDALSRVRSHVNSIKRNMMPLHIPPHVRDLKSRRLSEPAVTDDFGNFTFKNLPVLERANKDVIQKLRAEALATQGKSASINTSSSSNTAISPGGSMEANPIVSNSAQRNISCTKGSSARSSSPSAFSQANTSPNRTSQPSSPLLVSFIATQSTENRRKTSSTSSSLTHNSVSSKGQTNSSEASRIQASSQKPPPNVSSIKGACHAPILPLQTTALQKIFNPSQHNDFSRRTRSLTVDSQESSSSLPLEIVSIHKKRRSQVFEISPSSSDTEADRESALLRVQRRRQSSRRMSQISTVDRPFYRPLDVLICEDHPVTRMVTEKLLEKLRCRSITVSNGAEAVRFAMSEIKFDIIMMEFKLPQINGADVARMIRDTKNTNSQTPIIALTGYLKELQAPHQFDALIEKPPTIVKLTDVICRLCYWKPPAPGLDNSGSIRNRRLSDLRVNICGMEESSKFEAFRSKPISLSSPKDFSCENSVVSCDLAEKDCFQVTDHVPIIINRKATGDWEETTGLGIRNIETLSPPCGQPENLLEQKIIPSSSVDFHHHEQNESRDDEVDEFDDTSIYEKGQGSKTKTRRGSKLSIEMMRTNSRGSVISAPDLVTDKEKFKFSKEIITPVSVSKIPRVTPPDASAKGFSVTQIDMEETPKNTPMNSFVMSEESTPKALSNLFDHKEFTTLSRKS